MPRKQKEVHYYSVYISSYASLEARDRILNPGKHFTVSTEDFISDEYYSGYVESTAMRAFYRASKDAMNKDLAISVVFVKDFKTVIEMRPRT